MFSSLPKYVDGIPEHDGRAFIVPADAVAIECPAGAKGTLCADGCSTLISCAMNNKVPLTQTTCATNNPDKPYCNKGATSCSATPLESDETCKTAVKSSFICTDTGYFPDPKNCSRYIYCEEDSTAIPYTCPYYYVYNSKSNNCKLYTRASDCPTLSCAYVTPFPGYVLYAPQPSFYGLCVNATHVPIMFRCNDVDNEAYSISAGECQYQCKADGNYPDITNCAKYIQCYRYGYTAIADHKDCPPGTIFDAVKGNCKPGKCEETITAS